jgi:hypothetical protein
MYLPSLPLLRQLSLLNNRQHHVALLLRLPQPRFGDTVVLPVHTARHRVNSWLDEPLLARARSVGTTLPLDIPSLPPVRTMARLRRASQLAPYELFEKYIGGD